MGVVLTAATIGVATAIGVWSERRWPRGAADAARRALLLMLYVLLPPVIFFNLAGSEIDVGHGVGLVLGLVSYALSGPRRLVRRRPRPAPVAAGHRGGDLRRDQRQQRLPRLPADPGAARP